MGLVAVLTMMFKLGLFSFVADTVIITGRAIRYRIFRFGMCLLVLSIVTCLLPSGFNQGIIRDSNAPESANSPQSVDVHLVVNPAASGHAHLAANRRSFLSSPHTRRVVSPRISHPSSLPGNNPQLLRLNEQFVELDRLFSNAVPPVKAAFVFLC
jgi:hypothetical protein